MHTWLQKTQNSKPYVLDHRGREAGDLGVTKTQKNQSKATGQRTVKSGKGLATAAITTKRSATVAMMAQTRPGTPGAGWTRWRRGQRNGAVVSPTHGELLVRASA